MSIKAYVGIMGSGKTYEVVTVVIYNALARGRRVVSNIAGLDFEAMRQAMLAEGILAERIGELVCIPHEQVFDPLFWRTDHDQQDGIDAFIQPGDLIALDEIWRFWNGFGLKSEDGKDKRPDRVINFVRMHRQMTHPVTGVCCDLAIITQEVADIHRSVRGKVEETYSMTKLTSIGSSSRYRIDVFQNTRTTRKPLISHQRSYDPAKFCFYASHSQRKEGDAAPVEENIDGRGNILKGALFRFVLPVGVVVMGLAVWTVYKFFQPRDAKPPEHAAAAASPAAAPAIASHAKPTPDESDRWRVVGWISEPMRVVLSDGRRTRVLVPQSWKLSASGVEAFLPSGEAVTSWSGQGGGGLIAQAAGHQP